MKHITSRPLSDAGIYYVSDADGRIFEHFGKGISDSVQALTLPIINYSSGDVFAYVVVFSRRLLNQPDEFDVLALHETGHGLCLDNVNVHEAGFVEGGGDLSELPVMYPENPPSLGLHRRFLANDLTLLAYRFRGSSTDIGFRVLRGRVERGGMPVNGLNIVAIGTDAGQTRYTSLHEDPRGDFVIPLPPGEYRLFAQSPPPIYGPETFTQPLLRRRAGQTEWEDWKILPPVGVRWQQLGVVTVTIASETLAGTFSVK
jgi:hypothetical protein